MQALVEAVEFELDELVDFVEQQVVVVQAAIIYRMQKKGNFV